MVKNCLLLGLLAVAGNVRADTSVSTTIALSVYLAPRYQPPADKDEIGSCLVTFSADSGASHAGYQSSKACPHQVDEARYDTHLQLTLTPI